MSHQMSAVSPKDEHGRPSSVPLGEYMTAREVWPWPAGRSTAIFTIEDRHGGRLGLVKWYGAWRQFCFFPDPDTEPVFNNDCLNRISAFMRLCTLEQRGISSIPKGTDKP